METIKLRSTLKLKAGGEIPKGSILTFVRTHEVKPSVGIFAHHGVEYRLRFRNVIPMPSMKRIDSWVHDSVCESVFGNTCEPDGYGTHGEPSWLLALGLV
jgi:hypothetical protein